MGLIQKKDEHEVIDGVEVIERSDVPEDLPVSEVEIISGDSAEDIAAESAAEADPVAADGGDGEDASEPASEPCDPTDGAIPPSEPGDGSHEPKGHGCPRRNMALAVAVIAVVAAAIIGFFIGRGGFGSKGLGSATLTDGQLDTVVASWTYKGSTKQLTAREAIEAQYSLDAAKNDDGTYNAPSSEMVIAYARNQILLAEAESRGMTVTDEERDEYAKAQLGTSDYDQMASQFGVSVDQAKQIVTENATISKLYDEVVPATDGAAPEAPAEPADGNTEAASKEYADYIIKLAGDEWDASAGTWASEDGAFAQALAGSTTFSAQSATYSDAQTAYYVAYQEYATKAQDSQKAWSEFANGLYAKADMSLYGLYV